MDFTEKEGQFAMKISGLTILISGGGSGIVFALADAFIKAGSKVIICGRKTLAAPAQYIDTGSSSVYSNNRNGFTYFLRQALLNDGSV